MMENVEITKHVSALQTTNNSSNVSSGAINTVGMINNSPSINFISSIPIIQNTKMRTAIKSTCFAAVAIEPFYSYFIATQTNVAIQQLVNDFITEAPLSIILDLILSSSATFAVFNLFCDVTSVNPSRDADELIRSLSKENGFKTTTVKRALSLIIMGLAVTCSFPAGAAANGIPVESLATKFTSGMTADVIGYIGLGSLTFLGVTYYVMFNNIKIQRHVSAFIDSLKDIPAFNAKLIKDFLSYIEIFMQTVSNSSYRGIAFGFILSDVIQEVLHMNNTSEAARAAIWTAGLTTLLITFFSRTLSTKDYILNSKFDLLTNKEIQKASVISLNTISDAVLSLVRGGSLDVLLWSSLGSSILIKLLLAGSIGGITLMHSFYVRCMVRKKRMR